MPILGYHRRMALMAASLAFVYQLAIFTERLVAVLTLIPSAELVAIAAELFSFQRGFLFYVEHDSSSHTFLGIANVFLICYSLIHEETRHPKRDHSAWNSQTVTCREKAYWNQHQDHRRPSY